MRSSKKVSLRLGEVLSFVTSRGSNAACNSMSEQGTAKQEVLIEMGMVENKTPKLEGDPRRNVGVVSHGKKMENNIYTAFNSHSGADYGPYNI